MHVRQTPTRSGKVHAQIVESYRRPGGRSPSKKVLHHLGTRPRGDALEALVREGKYQVAMLKAERQGEEAPLLLLPAEVAKAIIERRQRAPDPAHRTTVTVEDVIEEGRVTVGVHEVFGPLYRRFGLEELFPARYRTSGWVFREAVLLRLAYPGQSKRAQVKLAQRHSPNRLTEDQVYGMMEQLTASRIQQLQAKVAEANDDLLAGIPHEVLFFDTTTLYFASERTDGLRRKGFSKDGKPHRVQVVLSVIMGRHGLPLGYQLHPGNTAEVRTLRRALAALRAQYGRGLRAAVVADAGMLSRDNLRAVARAGLDYVVAARLRKLPAAARDQICRLGNYTEAGPDGVRLLDTEVGGRRLVMRYDPVHARRQRHDREVAVAQARERIEQGTAKVRTDRYVTTKPGTPTLRLDRAAIAEDARYDGLHGVFTSLADDHAAGEIRARYSDLWSIEHGFRVAKHDLGFRPMYHWIETNVRAHIAICFAAFAMLRHLMHRMRALRPELGAFSESRLLDELRTVQASVLYDTEQDIRFMVPSAPTEFQSAIYRALDLRLPQHGQRIDPPD